MSEWTIDTLRELLLLELDRIRAENDRRFASQEKAVETAFDAAKEAVIKSEIGVEKRSDAVYVTITKLQDALAVVMPRAESEQRYSTLVDKLTELNDRINTSSGQSQGSQITKGNIYAALAAVVGILGLIVLVANHSFK